MVREIAPGTSLPLSSCRSVGCRLPGRGAPGGGPGQLEATGGVVNRQQLQNTTSAVLGLILSVAVVLTICEAVRPNCHGGLGESLVMNNPQGQGLYALLRRRESAQFLL